MFQKELHEDMRNFGPSKVLKLLRQQCMLATLMNYTGGHIDRDVLDTDMSKHPQRNKVDALAFLQLNMPSAVHRTRFWGKHAA